MPHVRSFLPVLGVVVGLAAAGPASVGTIATARALEPTGAELSDGSDASGGTEADYRSNRSYVEIRRSVSNGRTDVIKA
jgi:hypothetical protein